jgi:hypothetical protein
MVKTRLIGGTGFVKHSNIFRRFQIHRIIMHFVALMLMLSVAYAAPMTSNLQMRALHEIYNSTGGEQWNYDSINLGYPTVEYSRPRQATTGTSPRMIPVEST